MRLASSLVRTFTIAALLLCVLILPQHGAVSADMLQDDQEPEARPQPGSASWVLCP
jgi:hypothetical protein